MKLVLLLLSTPIWAQEPEAWDLKKLYASAFKISETIASSEAQIRQAEALYREALGSSLPEFFFRFQSLRQDKKGLSASTENPQNESSFRARKTLFSGYREIAAIRAGGSFVEQEKWEHASARQALLSDVSGAFYETLRSESDLEATSAILKLARNRLAEIQKRVKLGRSRQADMASAEYQAANLETRELEAERQSGQLRDLLSFLAGQTVRGALSTGTTAAFELAPLEQYLDRVSARPDVHAAEQAVRVSKAALHASRADHLPSADITGAYYTDRPAVRKNIDWDVTLSVDVPIFSWGAVNASAAGARAELEETQADLSLVRREAELEIRTAHRDFVFSKRQLTLQERAAAAARKDFNLQERDYGLGLITNLEVLESMNRLHEAETALNRARLGLSLAEVELNIASGLSPEEILK